MHTPFFSRRLAGGLIAIAAVLTGCKDDAMAPRAVSDKSYKVDYSLQISSTSAATGSRIAVRVAPVSEGSIMGLQGTLSYNHSALEYVGQAQGAGTLLNVSEHRDGDVGIIAVNHNGLGSETGTLVFEVKSAGYVSGLGFELSKAGLQGKASPMEIGQYYGVLAAPSLVVPADARVMDLAAWNAEIAVRTGKKIPVMLSPGQIPASGILQYGDVNLDATIDLFDILAVLNVSNNVEELIVGTNATPFERDMVIAGNVAPSNLPSGEPGRESDGSRVLDLFDILAILNDANGINDPIVGLNIPGRTGPVTPGPDSIITGNITTSITLSPSRTYILNAQVQVTNGATLTILPGTTVKGNTSVSPTPALIIARDGRINANGTAAQPILFSCTNPTSFTIGSVGCWGGVLILGNAQVNGFSAASQLIAGGSTPIAGRTLTGGCLTGNSEGAVAPATFQYGGCNDADSSGVLRYAIIENSGRANATDSELNSLGLAGVGYKTVIENIQILNGSDDGVEIWGGAVDVRNILIDGAEDDSFDISEGWGGRAQFVVIRQKEAFGDQCVEADNDPLNFGNTTPRGTYGRMWNFTCLGENAPGDATFLLTGDRSDGQIRFRRGNKSFYGNFYFEGSEDVFGIDAGQEAATCGTDALGFTTGFAGIRYARTRDPLNIWEVGNSTLCTQATATAEADGDNLRQAWTTFTATTWNATAALMDARPKAGRLSACVAPTDAALVGGTASSAIPGTPAVTNGRASAWFELNTGASFCGALDPDKIPFYSGWAKSSTNTYTKS